MSFSESSIEVILPWRGGCPHRDRALAEVLKRHTLSVTLAERPEGPWVKALAVMPAIERSEAEVIVVHDADVWTDGLPEAIQAVEAGAGWSIPHLNVHRLTEDGEPEQRPYRGISGGGILVAHREVLLAIPLDPRFVGWGQEDEAHGVALRTLVGAPWRGTADLWHYFHPPQQRLSRSRGSREGWNLRRRYMLARRDPEQMRALVQEAHVALATSQQAGDDRPALGVGVD